MPQPQSQPGGPVEVRLGGTDPIRTQLEALSSTSRTAIQRLISEIASITGREVTQTDPLDLFNSITSQTGGGGLYVDVRSRELKQVVPEDARHKNFDNAGGSGFAWHFWSHGEKNVQRIAVLFLKESFDPSEKGVGLIMASYFVTAIHEMTHIAPKDNREFDHPEMDRAGRDLGAYSFDDYIEKNCFPKHLWSRP